MENKTLKAPLFSGKVAFMLYDTYGFPLDLTQSILKDKGIEIDIEEFEAEMAKQKEIAKKSWAGSGDVKNNKIYFDVKEKIQPTEFSGYDKNTVMGKILAIIKDGKEVNIVKEGDEFEFFVDKTSFYGECGGQVGDTGLGIQIMEDGTIPLPFSIVEILDVKRPFNNYFLHKAKLENGSLKVGDYLNLAINVERRNKIRANHSSAHLLQYALRLIFGDSVMQKGSYVDENRMRFDFTLNKQISKNEIRQIEDIVNKLIFQNSPVLTKIMEIEEAKKIGAMALFNEKYEDKVRVLFMGEKENQNGKLKFEDYENNCEGVGNALSDLNNSSFRKFCSVELCGGTHAFKTGEIGLFKITGESSISSGVRRIESVTGLEAIKFMNKYQDIVESLGSSLQISLDEIVNKINSIIEENKILRKELNDINRINISKIEFLEENIDKIKFAYKILENVNPKDAKSAIMELQNKKYSTDSIILSIVKFESKLSIIIAVSKNLSDKIKANEIIKDVVKIAGGNGGGGQPWFAMGGANDDNDKKALEDIIKFVRNLI